MCRSLNLMQLYCTDEGRPKLLISTRELFWLVQERKKLTDCKEWGLTSLTVNSGRWSWRRIFLLREQEINLPRIQCVAPRTFLIWQSSFFPQVMRSRRQAGGTPQTQGQFELPDGYQYARIHYSGDPSQVSSKSLLSPQEILKLSMVIIVVPSILAISFLHVTGHKYVSSKC